MSYSKPSGLTESFVQSPRSGRSQVYPLPRPSSDSSGHSHGTHEGEDEYVSNAPFQSGL